jgi:hypothetical protein
MLITSSSTEAADIWSRPEEEMKAWLLAVLVARDGAKQYIDDGNESTI